MVAHRMLPSHRIEIHNDAPGVGSETHRFIVSLNREWRGDHGGYLAFLDGPSWDLLSDVYRPIHNTGAGLELSERSYHAVTEVKALARYTILYSFWPAARQGGTR